MQLRYSYTAEAEQSRRLPVEEDKKEKKQEKP